MRFGTTKDIENYIQDILGIPYVNLEGIPVDIGNEFANTLEEFFHLYPLFKNSICAIGQAKYMEEQCHLIELSDNKVTDDGTELFKWKDLHLNDIKGLQIISDLDEKKHPVYLGLSIPSFISKNNLETLNMRCTQEAFSGFHPRHNFTFKSFIYHELGHVFDYVLRISENREFLALLQTIDIEKEISIYGSKNSMEAFAEAFAEYHAKIYPNEAVTKIMDFALAEYRKEL